MELSKFLDYPLWVRIAGILWLASSLALGYALLFSRPIRKEERIPDAQLVTEAKQLAQELFTFCNQRQANQPNVDNRDWRLLAYSSETNNLYASGFKARVLSTLEEFSKRNLIGRDFDRSWAEQPTNYIGLNEVASSLNELALKLEKLIRVAKPSGRKTAS
jgi:hypothetical protein